MRVIAGTAKGIRLIAPKGLKTRPTLDRVREALFNILGPRLEDAHFLDLFAGTGANGIEALSRGACQSVLVDHDPLSLDAMAQNLERARLADRAVCLRLTLPQGLAAVTRVRATYDIIFADPPYRWGDYDALLTRIRDLRLLASDGLIVFEHAGRTPLPDHVCGYACGRRAAYGDTMLSFYADGPQDFVDGGRQIC